MFPMNSIEMLVAIEHDYARVSSHGDEDEDDNQNVHQESIRSIDED